MKETKKAGHSAKITVRPTARTNKESKDKDSKERRDLSAAERNKLPKSEFGEPEERKYPMPDKAHAQNAKARASQAENAGRISKAEEKKIDAKSDKVLGKARKGA